MPGYCRNQRGPPSRLASHDRRGSLRREQMFGHCAFGTAYRTRHNIEHSPLPADDPPRSKHRIDVCP